MRSFQEIANNEKKTLREIKRKTIIRKEAGNAEIRRLMKLSLAQGYF